MTETPQELIARLTGFTPGTWELDLGKGDWLGGFYSGETAVCNFGCDTTYYPTAGETPNHWNAALIAAAPDLHRELAASLAREVVLEQKLEDERDNARAAYERGYWERGNGE
jgi:hypothetical protein